MRALRLRRAIALGVAIAGCSVTVAEAQAPPYPPPPGVVAPPPGSPEAADIAACLCLRQSVDALSTDMAARRRSYDELKSELARLDAQLEQQRTTIDVNNQEAVAHFRQQLQQRDALFRQSTGAGMGELSGVVDRYNAAVNEYNARCANRPRDPVLVDRVRATLSCPAP